MNARIRNWTDYWICEEMGADFGMRQPLTWTERQRFRIAAWLDRAGHRAAAARAALRPNNFELLGAPSGVKALYVTKALVCIALGRTQPPDGRSHHSIELSSWNCERLYAGWRGDFIAVGPGLGDWWVDIYEDGDWWM